MIFGLFSSSPKTISYAQIEDTLKDISILDYREREYLLGVFSAHRQNGITKREVKEAIKDLKQWRNDVISDEEARKVEHALLQYFT